LGVSYLGYGEVEYRFNHSNAPDIALASEGGMISSRFRGPFIVLRRERLDLEKDPRVPLDSISISQKLNDAAEAPIMNLVYC
jgi:hypothetical protein